MENTISFQYVVRLSTRIVLISPDPPVSSLRLCLDRQDVRTERHLLCQEAGEEDSGEPEQENPLLQPGDREAPQTVSADSGQSLLSLYSVIGGFLRTLVKEPR